MKSVKQMISSVSKFSFAEMFSNDNGKTSGSGVMGVIVSFVATICFAYGCIIKNNEIITQSSFVIGLGSGLLLGRKIVGSKTIVTGTDSDSENDAIPDDLGADK